jgi:hypothetical protein
MELKDLTDARCFDEQRRAAVLKHPTLNGIDFVEYFEDRTVVPHRYWLVVTLLKPPPDATFYGLVGHPEQFSIDGGARVVGIRATEVKAGGQPNQLEVTVSEPGDFSIYTLSIASAALDPHLASIPLSFKASCPTEFDCRTEPDCPPTILAEPALDYLAKDYASFRRLLLDLIPQRNPRWLERNPADLGMALVELLAYNGDYLSYFQDAVATESYLDTCRRRISARRHARLVDYQMHDGRNAWGFVQLDVTSTGIVQRGTMLLTQIARPLSGQASSPGITIPIANLNFDTDPVLQDVHVFETTAQISADPLNNRMRIHTWGNGDCCLARGAMGAYLYGVRVIAGAETAVRPALAIGDFLLFEEVKGPVTGLEADSNPTHRQVVRLVSVEPATDPVYQDQLNNGQLVAITAPGPTALPLLKVAWREEDALTFPLCISIKHAETDSITDASIARGNVIPCDHGRTIEEPLALPSPSGGRTGLLQTRIPKAPLTFQTMPANPNYDDHGRLLDDRYELNTPAREAQPAVVLLMNFPPNVIEPWIPVPDLLESHPFDRQFVVETENDGSATLRFGDDEYGHLPADVLDIIGRYRVGNGSAGNIGSGSLAHIVSPVVLGSWPTVQKVRQPLPAYGGTEAESIEEVRQLAPRAFQAEQFRAVTESDYERAALKLANVAAANCTFRWTGSWLTVFIAIHPRNLADLITETGGRTRLSESLERKARAQLMRYKLAGYDLEVRTAQYVPLEINVEICVARGYFRGDVLEGVSRALSNRQYADGTTGFFHPSRFAFGQGIYLSQFYEVVEKVEGVDSAVVKVFKRYWMIANNELENGLIPIGPSEIARLDNDPNFMENGVLRLTAIGGL